MRLVLALLAVVALLASPVTAVAAQVACGQTGSMAMDGMDMPMAADPCCDHGDRQTPSDKSCVQACATICGVTAALPGSLFEAALAVVRTSVVAAPVRSLLSHDPPRLDRPPKRAA